MTKNQQFEDDARAVEQATQLTTDSVRRLIEQNQSGKSPDVSLLSVAERDELIEEVGRILPAGNVLSFVLNGIITTRERHIDDGAAARSHFNALLKGLSVMRDNMIFQLAFAGPATVLAGYNMLLELAGADVDHFLPEGAWQFYVEFGLREDAAHHQTETIAFQALMQEKRFNEADQLAAWLFACVELLRDYDRLLELIWEENVRLEAMETYTGLTGLHREWQRVRPFAAPDTHTNLVDFRQQRFEAFYKHYMGRVSEQQWRAFSHQWFTPDKAEEIGRRKRAYVRQMSLRRYLEPGEYGDERHPIDPRNLCIAVVYRNNYYLFDLNNDSLEGIRSWAQGVVSDDASATTGVDTILSRVPRSSQLRVRSALGREQREELERLRKAPIIINWDVANGNQPLSYIRLRQRGIGDHALTIFRTNRSTVFDYSHIFFDGYWAMGIAEILTNEAMKHAQVISQMQRKTARPATVKPLDLRPTQKVIQLSQRFPQPVNYISAEHVEPITPLQETRRTIRARTDIRLTINDLLVLYRTIFNQIYAPGKPLVQRLHQLKAEPQGAVLARQIDAMFTQMRKTNPSLLIPIDASRYDPKERLFPSTFRSPIPNFRAEHNQLLDLLEQASRRGIRRPSNAINEFYDERENYLAYLRAFSILMQRYREIALEGESMSATAIRLIAGLPDAMRKLADDIPGQLSIVNDAIKGEEVFSNVGRVVPGSSITRFASAKDDNDKKVLVWGVMSNDYDQLYITLRDFRPAVMATAKAGHVDVAQLITQDFLSAYVRGLVTFSEQMQVIMTTSRKRR